MIFLSRDFEGKVTAIHILTTGGYAVVPINLQTFEIDWKTIDYPSTRESIKSAWDSWAEGKDLSFELRARPELAPPQPIPQPDWLSLKIPFFMSSAYQKLIDNPTNKAVLAASSLQSSVLSYIAGQTPTYPLLKNFWDTLIGEYGGVLSQEDIDELIAIALATKMKFNFGADGKMILS